MSAKMGRPKGEPTEMVHCRMPVELADRLRAAAAADDRTAHSIVRLALVDWLAAWEKRRR
jgi:hypothetical protein